jgi:ABC-2 type transport system permease protein
MLNLIRADVYRLVHGKMLWVTTGGLALFYFLGGTGKFTPTFRTTVGSNRIEQAGIILSGSQAPFAFMASPVFLIYFFLPLIVMVAGADFSSGAVKNTLAKGVSRFQFYLSKLLLAYIIAIVFDLLQVGLPLLSGTIILGFGRSLDAGYLEGLAEAFLLQLPLFLGVVSVGVFLIFLARNTIVASLAYLGLFTAAQFVAFTMPAPSANLAGLLPDGILNGLRLAVASPGLTAQDIIRMVALGAGYMMVMTLLGMLVFQKSDFE